MIFDVRKREEKGWRRERERERTASHLPNIAQTPPLFQKNPRNRSKPTYKDKQKSSVGSTVYIVLVIGVGIEVKLVIHGAVGDRIGYTCHLCKDYALRLSKDKNFTNEFAISWSYFVEIRLK